MIKKIFFIFGVGAFLQVLVTACCPDSIYEYTRVNDLKVSNSNLTAILDDSASVTYCPDVKIGEWRTYDQDGRLTKTKFHK